MNKQLVLGLLAYTLFFTYSCKNNNNNQSKNEEPSYADTVLSEQPVSAPITVSAREMCSDFTSNSGIAMNKYRDNILLLSGTVHQAQSLSEDDCNYLTMKCSDSESSADATPLLIKCCILDIKLADSLKEGDMITLRARFREFNNNIVLLDEVAQ